MADPYIQIAWNTTSGRDIYNIESMEASAGASGTPTLIIRPGKWGGVDKRLRMDSVIQISLGDHTTGIVKTLGENNAPPASSQKTMIQVASGRAAQLDAYRKRLEDEVKTAFNTLSPAHRIKLYKYMNTMGLTLNGPNGSAETEFLKLSKEQFDAVSKDGG